MSNEKLNGQSKRVPHGAMTRRRERISTRVFETYRVAVIAVENLERMPKTQRSPGQLEKAIRDAENARQEMKAVVILERLARNAESDPDRALDPFLDELEILCHWKELIEATSNEIERLNALPAGKRFQRSSRIAGLVGRHNWAKTKLEESLSTLS